jgi:hypothetical protein
VLIEVELIDEDHLSACLILHQQTKIAVDISSSRLLEECARDHHEFEVSVLLVKRQPHLKGEIDVHLYYVDFNNAFFAIHNEVLALKDIEV